MIVTQFVLDDFLYIFHSELLKLMRADLNIVRLGKIAPSRRGQPTIESRLMQKRTPKRVQRYLLHPLLQLLVIHSAHPRFFHILT